MTPILYIFIRNDLVSMNAGKAAAQAAHAANQFIDHNPGHPLIEQWQKSTSGGFGTTLVYGANREFVEDIDMAIQQSGRLAGRLALATLIHGVVHDPSYPVRDGSCVHYVPLNTCAYIFGYRETIQNIINYHKLSLWP